MRGFAELKTSSINSKIQEHECKIRILVANLALKRRNFGFRKRDVFIDVNA